MAFLRSELGLSDDEVVVARLRAAYGLTPQLGLVLALLHRRGERPTSWLLIDEALPRADGERDRSNPRAYANNRICLLKRALGEGGVENLRGAGWRLTATARQFVARAAEHAAYGPRRPA